MSRTILHGRQPVTLALAVWTLLVWTTRIRNIWGDDALSTGEQWGRTALALSFTVLALVVVVAWWQRARWLVPAVTALAGWTTAVWVIRSLGIVTADHSGAFVAVHLVLAAVSVALSAAAWRETTAPPARTPRPARQ